MHAVFAAFHIYAQRGEDAAKMRGWRLCIKNSHGITSLIMENHGIVFLNFCGNLSSEIVLETISNFAWTLLYVSWYNVVVFSLEDKSYGFVSIFSNQKAKFPVKLTEPLTSILYVTADKIHMEEYKHAIHVKEIAEGMFTQ